MSHITLFVCVLVVSYAGCSLITTKTINGQESAVITRDLPIEKDEVGSKIEVPQEVENDLQLGDKAGANPEKKCAEVGEFCNNNGDCCSNSCLGFMKRCVSGSG